MRDHAYKNLSRLYMPLEDISSGLNALLSEGQLHYLKNVMRLEAGDQLRVFNGRNGEWLAMVEELSKKKGVIRFVEKLVEQNAAPDAWVLASPVKKEAFEWMVEKSTELGASRFIPVICDHTVVHRVNEERMALIATEAAEQSEWLDLMETASLDKLQNVLNSWPSGRKLIFCIERELAAPLLDVTAKIAPGTPVALLIGPEGGFSKAEIKLLQGYPFVESVSLGTRILKAETALIAALAGLQFSINK